MEQREINHKGKILKVVELDFQITSEQWNTYKTYDGIVLRMKTSPIKIMRILDDEGKVAVNDVGDPHLIVNHETTIVTRVGA